MERSFGGWLLRQQARTGTIGNLAKAAAQDPRYPRTGTAEAVSKRLNELEADGDMHLALEDAELEWQAAERAREGDDASLMSTLRT